MHPLQSFAETCRWAGNDLAYNLDFIASDRLDWRPAPEAKSALEIVNHVILGIGSMLPILRGEEWSMPDLHNVTTRKDAQDRLREAANDYADAITRVHAQDLSRDVTIWGHYHTWLGRAATMPVIDLIHHRGQVVYIQCLLGDAEDHFAAE